jgi:signal transduction histidine kinase
MRHWMHFARIRYKISEFFSSLLVNRVLNNLLENELAHLPAGRQIHLRLRCKQDSAELVIEDNGPGFPPDIIARAFERFVKGKNSPGHGLGLAFVDAVIQAHGGSVSIANRATGGAVISILLPVHGPHNSSTMGSATSSRNFGPTSTAGFSMSTS